MANGQELEQRFQDCMPLFIALGDEMRLAILAALTRAVRSGRSGGLNVNEITCQTSLSRPAISHHLKILRESGLVEVQRSGTSNYYRPALLSVTRELMKLGNLVEDFFSQETLREP
ncbi:MAG: metalloregulator ArsR/SmtB family transcription factor [Eubacteriales bacterium]|nr:metalloregulator ArsR/SmtB family transcription factor [Eubacteriales bacterium]